MADRHDLLDHLRGRVGGAGARAPEVADEGGCADPLKHCRTLIETESEASKDTKEAQAHLDQNVLARCAAGSPSHDSGPVLSKNTNELKTGAPGRFDRHRPVASPRSGACRRRCRRFGFSVRAGKTPSSNGMPRSRAETWIQARAAPGPERASLLRPGSPRLDPGPLGWPLFGRRTAPGQRPAPLFGANVALENRG